jgi:hypothetical protein
MGKLQKNRTAETAPSSSTESSSDESSVIQIEKPRLKRKATGSSDKLSIVHKQQKLVTDEAATAPKTINRTGTRMHGPRTGRAKSKSGSVGKKLQLSL